ncbi:MAG TPA: TauD/TfdA family dioxygenase [Xanthobacteraceae bacterium]|nr:TauD/TfdA family dioxygenase [Xanthobacteraceae bacterium]
MDLVIRPLHPLYAAEIRGVDLSRDVDLKTQQAIEHAMDAYAVCVVPEQNLDDERQIAFSRLYGPLENASAVKHQRKAGVMGNRVRHPEIFDVSNLDENGNILAGDDARWVYRQANELWHSDSSFRQKSSTWSLLHARVVPPSGGDTYFADTRAAYDALPEAMKARLEGLVAEHSIWHSRSQRGGYVPTDDERAARPPARHPVVRRHPGSGRKALFIASHASHIVGWPVDEGRALLDELIAFATEPRFVYVHTWRVGDLVIWDNRATMHRASPFSSNDHKREMHRTTIIDTRGDSAQ